MALINKLTKTQQDFIKKQSMFFVATAAEDGRVNVSPKGMGTLNVLNDSRITWLNLSGSGNETAAHIRKLSRMTLMFCSFDEQPMILRVYGTAKVLHAYDDEWQKELSHFPELAGSRQIFELEIESVQASCGTGVPVMSFERVRADTELVPFYAKMGEEGLSKYWRKKNSESIDGFETGIFMPRVNNARVGEPDEDLD